MVQRNHETETKTERRRRRAEKGCGKPSRIIGLNCGQIWSVQLAIEVRSGEGIDESVLVSSPLVAFPSVFFDDVRYPAANLGVHSWIPHCLFALVTREFNGCQ